MKFVLLVALFAGALCGFSDPGCNAAAADNVNSRYTIESIELNESIRKRVSKFLREDIERLVGAPFDQQLIDDLAQRLRSELRLSKLTSRIERGTQPEHVRVVFETESRVDPEDATVTKAAYHHKQGWTGGLEVGFEVADHRIEFGLQSDADALLERFAGVTAGWSHPIGDWVRVRFDLGSYHQQWNRATLEALDQRQDVPGIYRTRLSMAPAVMVRIGRPLTLTAGFDFQHLETQFPAARTESANSWETTLRYRGQWEASFPSGQELDAGYNLRAATRMLDSDYVYTRHTLDARYALGHERHELTLRFIAGGIIGAAPLFERYSLGNTSTLRGWHKFDVAPLGGDRVAHGSVQYRYRAFGVFYDTGSVWEHEREADVRHSAGATLALGMVKEGPYLTLAFPIRSGAVQPLFMMTMNF